MSEWTERRHKHRARVGLSRIRIQCLVLLESGAELLADGPKSPEHFQFARSGLCWEFFPHARHSPERQWLRQGRGRHTGAGHSPSERCIESSWGSDNFANIAEGS